MNKCLVAVVVSSDFERTKYVLQTVVGQEKVDFDLLILGERKMIESVDQLFEILNYSNISGRIKTVFYDEDKGESAYVHIAEDIAFNRGCTELCFVPREIAFYDSSSLYRLKKKAGRHLVIGKSIIINSKGEYSAQNNKIENSLTGIIYKKVRKPKILEIPIGQRICDDKKEERKTMLNIAFFVTSYSVWSSLQTMYEAALKSNRVTPVIVYVSSAHVNKDLEVEKKELDTFTKAGYSIVAAKDYDVYLKKPDMVMYCLPYSTLESGFNIDEVSKVVKRCIYIPYGPQLQTRWNELLRLRFKTAMLQLAWRVIYSDEPERIEALENIYGDGHNIVALGIPRLDLDIQLTKDSYPEYAKIVSQRAKGRKIILWNTHHSINTSENSFSSWKNLGDGLLNYIEMHNDAFFLWRPHPYFEGALKKYLGENKYSELMQRVAKFENVYIDKEMSYLPAFSIADFMLSDASSLAKEFLYTGKPVIITVPNMDVIENIHPYDCLYIYDKIGDVEKCITNILEGKDILYDKRADYYRSVTGSGNIGERIMNYLINEYDNETSLV